MVYGDGVHFLPGDEAEFIISRERCWQHVDVDTKRNSFHSRRTAQKEEDIAKRIHGYQLISIEMLVIEQRGGGGGGDGGMGRYYGGSDIFDSFSRKMLASGLKKAISSGAKSVIAQKVAEHSYTKSCRNCCE